MDKTMALSFKTNPRQTNIHCTITVNNGKVL